jgi:mannosyltransferase
VRFGGKMRAVSPRNAALTDRRAHHLLLAGALALAAGLRFTALDARGWWRDEAVTVELLRLPFGELLRTIPDSEGTPPLYYILAWGWSRVFGDSEVGLRSFSALVGTLTVLVVYLAGRELLSRRAGIVAAYLAASSPLLVWHDQDARSYALLVLLSALSFLFFVRLLSAPTSADATGFAMASILALATHYFAVFLIFSQVVWLLATSRTRRRAVVPSFAIGAAGLALVPLALAQRGSVSWVAEVPRARRIVEIAQHFLVGPQPPWEVPVTLLAGLLLLAALALLVLRGSDRERRAVIPAVVVGTAALLVPLVLAFGGLDYVLSRNVIVAWTPLALVVAAGLVVRRAGALGILVAAAIVVPGAGVVASTASTPKFGVEDWRGAARALGPPPPSGRVIVLWPGVGADPFLLYRPQARRLPAAGASVSEVVLVTFGSRRSDPEFQGSLTPPRPPFTLSSREDERYFTIVRFQADDSVSVTTAGLVDTILDIPGTSVLAER